GEWRSTAIHLPGILSREEKGRGGQVCWPGDQVRVRVGMETAVPVRLGVAAECAELLGMEPSGQGEAGRGGQVC
ncbi:MAG: hypothetical protein SGI72_06240, partial [Planctomycetota bacterium]|nr:hypothetical protein [Planctomycetota bacterium]